MRSNTQVALAVSLFVLAGFPIFFFIVSMAAGQWNYLLFSIPASMTAGLTGLMLTIQQIKKERKGIKH
ncbi:hypothetical protein CVD28_12445 [Bacillus sp. M6-12]|uniref:hypothetical protein n=1 Tax=Bacillus sp. M6-12 TaxID=2054166 RepID=UPI000C76168E|nr:hypothetical protein [Bacillus sp. M6-12]PLS17369.1 hypothetical protein CVD28_12445 [Bacillus sp. M6-12]